MKPLVCEPANVGHYEHDGRRNLMLLSGRKDLRADFREAVQTVFIDAAALLESAPKDERDAADVLEACLRSCRELLRRDGSVFTLAPPGEAHRTRLALDKVFGEKNLLSQIVCKCAPPAAGRALPVSHCALFWHAVDRDKAKTRPLWRRRDFAEWREGRQVFRESSAGRRLLGDGNFSGDGAPEFHAAQGGGAVEPFSPASPERESDGTHTFAFEFRGEKFLPAPGRAWLIDEAGMRRLARADRLAVFPGGPRYKARASDLPLAPLDDDWTDLLLRKGPDDEFSPPPIAEIIQRCLLLASDPGDLALDPCSLNGATAFAAEQWGRRWITVHPTPAALAKARARLLAARFPWLRLRGEEGTPNPARGFIYESVARITPQSVAADARIDEIWEEWSEIVDPLLARINRLQKRSFQEWELPMRAAEPWPHEAARLHAALGKAYRVKMPDAKTRPLLERLGALVGRKYKKIEQLPEKPETPWKEEAAQALAELREAQARRRAALAQATESGALRIPLLDRPVEDRERLRKAGPFDVIE